MRQALGSCADKVGSVAEMVRTVQGQYGIVCVDAVLQPRHGIRTPYRGALAQTLACLLCLCGFKGDAVQTGRLVRLCQEKQRVTTSVSYVEDARTWRDVGGLV